MLQRNQCISIYWSRNMLWIYDSLNSERLKSNGSISHCYHSVYSRKLHVVGLMKTQLTAKWKKYETTEINEESGWEVKRVELLLVNTILSASLLTDWAHNPHYHEGSESICCTLWPLCWEAWHHFYQFQRIRGAYICLLCQAFRSGPTFLMLSITVLLGFDSTKTHLWSKNCQTYLSKFVCGMWIVKWSSSVHILPSQHTPVCSFCPWRTPHSVKQKKLGSTVFITWFSPGGMFSSRSFPGDRGLDQWEGIWVYQFFLPSVTWHQSTGSNFSVLADFSPGNPTDCSCVSMSHLQRILE